MQVEIAKGEIPDLLCPACDRFGKGKRYWSSFLDS